MEDSTNVSFGYSPYPDEIYMFYGLLENTVDKRDFNFDFVKADIEILNEHSLDGELDVTSISFPAYPLLSDHFELLMSGGRFGDKEGPVLIGREQLSRDEVRSETVAIPGELTTATLLLKLYAGHDIDVEPVPHDLIPEQVEEGNFTAGVVVDDTILNIGDVNVTSVLNFGEWWYEKHQLPLPLGGCAVRKDLPFGSTIGTIIEESVQYAL
ncbi:MAG: MqnA/MqnD/SBP family protein, partial [bacterium]